MNLSAGDSTRLTQSTEFLDHAAAPVRNFVRRARPARTSTATDWAVALYYAVRDGILYEVYGTDLSREGLRASTIASCGSGFCVHKSILYAAAVRSVGIPSRIIVAEVRNHLASERLKQLVGGDTFVHCLTSIHLEDRWVKVTPVFNRILCRLYGISPLEFDGRSDSTDHPFDQRGRERMQFVRTLGEFDDFPYEDIVSWLHRAHPRLFETPHRMTGGSLTLEAPGAKPGQTEIAG
jgi:transglutaminase-like putative cysteine protease